VVEAGPFDVMENGRMSAIQDPTGARSVSGGRTIGTQRANEPGTPIGNESSPDVARPRSSTPTSWHGHQAGHGRGRPTPSSQPRAARSAGHGPPMFPEGTPHLNCLLQRRGR
jgi:hypothetical protein